MSASSQHNNNEETANIPFTGTRRGDGGTYLVIVDDSDEFSVALHYAARTADARRAAMAIAHITNLEDFVHWGKVETMMRQDMRKTAEKSLWSVAKTVNEAYNLYPILYARQGEQIEEILNIIEEDKSIRALILAGNKNSNNQGPLVSYFSGKGLSGLSIPVIIVPGHLDIEAIHAIT